MITDQGAVVAGQGSRAPPADPAAPFPAGNITCDRYSVVLLSTSGARGSMRLELHDSAGR
jgi:hypothetical protein